MHSTILILKRLRGWLKNTFENCGGLMIHRIKVSIGRVEFPGTDRRIPSDFVSTLLDGFVCDIWPRMKDRIMDQEVL